MRVGFLGFEDFHGKSNIGSTRIRAQWLIDNWPEAERFMMGQKYDVVVFQKVYWVEYAEAFDGIKILDICDPDWMDWGNRVKQMLDLCDACTCNTEETAKFIRNIAKPGFPVYVVPDRLDIQTLPAPKKPTDNPTKTVGWYGYSHNYEVLAACIQPLIKLGIERLVVISDKPFHMPAQAMDKIELANYPYTPETINRDIQECDVILNPQLQKGRWKYKSNNKTILAEALGVPVAHTDKELKELMTAEQRKQAHKYDQVRQYYDVIHSVEEMKRVIADAQLKRERGGL